jgi:hypothetical protein
MRARGLSGVALKDDSDQTLLGDDSPRCRD